MREYDIIKPATEYDLGEELRSGPLTGRILDITVQRRLDELAARRGESSDEETFQFHVEQIYARRPTFIMGMVAIRETLLAARIDSVGKSDDDRDNKLKLIVP